MSAENYRKYLQYTVFIDGKIQLLLLSTIIYHLINY